MGRIFVVDLEGRAYRCKFCETSLALVDDLISRAFHSRRGKAYLFNNAVNITVGPHEERMMLSGLHTVADIYCCCCGQNLGWKYEAAHEKSQKYKEGKYVLERARIIDSLDSEFYIDTRPSMSDTEEEEVSNSELCGMDGMALKEKESRIIESLRRKIAKQEARLDKQDWIIKCLVIVLVFLFGYLVAKY